MFGETGGPGDRETRCLPNFDATFDPLWHIRLFICTKKSPAGSDDENSRSFFKSGKYDRKKHNWLNLRPFGKMSSTISLHLVRKIVIIVWFSPMTCRILRMTFVGDRANIFEDGQEYWN
jgi:hypothetical protein